MDLASVVVAAEGRSYTAAVRWWYPPPPDGGV